MSGSPDETIRIRRDDLDGIRAIAVFAILLFHAGVSFLPGGYIGVDIFFVLSGYLITHLLIKDLNSPKFSAAAFYAKRFSRLLPAAVTTIIVTLLISKFLIPDSMLRNVFLSSVASIFYVSNIFFWMDSGYFSDEAITKPLLHMWSLSVEEQFYLIYPLLLWGSYKTKGIQLVKYVVLLSTLLSFLLCVYLTANYPSSAYYMMPSRFWELGVGALLILFNVVDLDDRPSHSRLPMAVGLLSMVGIILCIITYDEETAFPGYAALLPVLCTALLIWSSSRALPVQRFLSLTPLVFTGRISYSLYLVHWPVVVFLFITDGNPGTIEFAIKTILISYFIAFGLYSIVEQPCMKLRRYGTSKMLILSGAGTIATLAIVTLIAFLPSVTTGTKDPVLQRLQQTVADSGRKVPCDYRSDAYCYFGDGKSPATLAFVGDSHALMIKEAVRQTASAMNTNIILVTLGAFCPPLLDLNTYTKTRTLNRGCRERRSDLFQNLSSAGVTDIVLVGRWHAYMEPMPGVSLLPLKRDDTSAVELRAVFLNSLKETAGHIRTLDMSVHLMEQIPESNCQVKTILSQAKSVADYDAMCPPLAIEKVNRQVAISAAELQKMNMKIVPTHAAFCDESVCRSHVDHKTLYDDDNHITVSGNELLAQFWLKEDAIESVLGL